MTHPKLNIAILPINATDLPALAKLESDVFRDDPFSITAFGKKKDTPENLAIRVKGLEKMLLESGERRTVNWKAVVLDEACGEGEGGGKEKIVGWSCWSFVGVGDGGGGGGGNEGCEEVEVVEKGKVEGDAKESEGVVEEKEKTEKEETEKEETNQPNSTWGLTANPTFIQEIFLVSDKWMLEATKGNSYAKLNVLVIHPSYQRLGIGSKMLEQGLRDVDEGKLQCVLGASPEGKGLYERFGFGEVRRMEVDLGAYENGEGLGWCVHGVMWRGVRG